MRLIRLQLGFGLGNILPAGTGHLEIQRFLIGDHLCIGNVERGPGVIEILLACGASAGNRRQISQPLVLPPCVYGVRLGGIESRARLGNLFGATAVTKPLHDRLLSRHLRFGFGELRAQASGVQSGQHLALAHTVAFLNQHGGDALAIVERQLDLPQIDIAVNQAPEFGPGDG